MVVEYFTPQWQRPRRKNDAVTVLTKSSPFWHQYPCLICGKTKDESPQNPKRCSRCKSTVYCSLECQKHDFGEGKHKSHCNALGKLWAEKERLEKCLWYGSDEKASGNSSTNPFDDDYQDPNEPTKLEDHKYAVIVLFWHDQPQTTLQKYTTQYCVTLLQLVQLLGRAESWRVSRIVSAGSKPFDIDSFPRTKPLNSLSLELAVDIAFTLFHLDRTDRRVRLLIPSLLLEGGYYQEAYNFIKYWTKSEGCLTILDLALPGGAAADDDQSYLTHVKEDQDMLEPPEAWIDGEIVYPSLGMVFELAYFKCNMLVLLQNKPKNGGKEKNELLERAAGVGEDGLKQQVNLLLSLVHKWNPHLLPALGKELYDVHKGALASTSSCKGSTDPRIPPALNTLLNLHQPGFELQYSFGNPGGGSVDEAASIWQRDMILWHVINPLTMEYLSQFCNNLKENLVDTRVLTGEGETTEISNSTDIATSVNPNKLEEQRKAAEQRKEAEELVAKLQRENSNRTMDQIMMHPDMAALMIKHLHTE